MDREGRIGVVKATGWPGEGGLGVAKAKKRAWEGVLGVVKTWDGQGTEN